MIVATARTGTHRATVEKGLAHAASLIEVIVEASSTRLRRS